MLRTLVFEMLALHPAQSQCYKNQTIYYMGQNYLRKKAWCILGSLKAEIVHDGGTKTLVYWDQNGHEQEKLITLHNCEQFAIRCGLSGGTFGNSCR